RMIGGFPTTGAYMSKAAVPAPNTFEALGIRRSLLDEIALKTIYLAGESSVKHLADEMKIAPALAEQLWQRLRQDQLCEAIGMVGPAHRFRTTAGGRMRALDLLAANQYIGPAPVSLDDYSRRIQWQTVRNADIGPDDLKRAFESLVIDNRLLSQLGAALISGQAIFLYGPPGTGKTTVAEALAAIVHQQRVWVPYAVEMDGQIITVLDPQVHGAAAAPSPSGADPRWVLCQRPRVIVGGELTMDMLDLQYNPVSRFYSAPVQMKANNGVLIVDDFGRERISPTELLNRWVVPLDRRIDFLSLAGGKKIEIPFDVTVIFATNLDVNRLVDEAFLRRIQTKIKIEFVTPPQFKQIFANVCRELNLECESSIADAVLSIISDLKQPLRACQARDLLNQVCWKAKYEGSEPRLD